MRRELPDITTRMDAVERLTKLFRVDRMVHLGVMSLSLVMLLASAGLLLYEGSAGPAELTGLFGSSDLITYSAGRLLYLWTRHSSSSEAPRPPEDNDGRPPLPPLPTSRIRSTPSAAPRGVRPRSAWPGFSWYSVPSATDSSRYTNSNERPPTFRHGARVCTAS